MVVYDITKRQTFDNIQTWLDDVRNESPKNALIILIGNKIDLYQERQISYDEGNDFAKKNEIMFAETSAKTGEGVDDIFRKSAKEIEQRINDNFYDLSSESCGIKKGNYLDNKSNEIALKSNNKSQKKCCF